ncbi:hypothetical protein [Paenibacillus xylanivorans]|nr:hypothetical protein [Paenibacillus xylanivorans]
MNSRLNSLLQVIRHELEHDDSSIIYGDMQKGIDTYGDIDANLVQFYEFLKISNGARFGSIDLWAYEELERQQYRLDQWIGESDNWLEIGQLLYEPVVISKLTGEISILMDEVSINDSKKIIQFDDFLIHYILGKGYEELVPGFEYDEWYHFLVRLKLI